MGNTLGCRKCEHCHQCPGCGPPCANTACSKLVVQSHLVCSDGSAAAVQHYPVPGEECSAQRHVCRDFHMPESEATNASSDSIQFILPLAPIPNIGCRKSISDLEDEFRFNCSKVQKIKDLAESYTHWRPIRGDGNCYYRSVIYGAIETLIAACDVTRVERLVQVFHDVHFDQHDEQQAHDSMLNQLCSWINLKQLEQWSMDVVIDEAIIRACRRLVRFFLIQHADDMSPNGLTYWEIAQAMDSTYKTMEDFCTKVVDPMGRDAETLALDALPKQLGVGLRIWMLDRREEVDLIRIDTPAPDGTVDVHVLFKPGHYDLLYPRFV